MSCFNCKKKIPFLGKRVKCMTCRRVFCLNCSCLNPFNIEKSSKDGWCNICFINISEHQLNDDTNLKELLSPSRDVREIMSQFVEISDPHYKYESWSVIHSSSKSQVFAAISKKERCTFAIKQIKEENNFDKALNEFLFPNRVIANNIVRSYEIFHFNEFFYIVSEFMEMNLLDYIKNCKFLKEKIVLHLIRQIANGLNEIHEKSMSHRDLKPSNIFIDKRGLVKIGDFGEMGSTKHRDLLESMVGSPLYCAPEILREEPYTHLCDIWSLGITILEMTKSNMYSSSTIYSLMEEIKEKEPPKINSRYSWNLECLVNSCLQKNPSTRINARQLLSLPPLKNAKDCTRLIAKKIKKIQQKELNNYG